MSLPSGPFVVAGLVSRAGFDFFFVSLLTDRFQTLLALALDPVLARQRCEVGKTEPRVQPDMQLMFRVNQVQPN